MATGAAGKKNLSPEYCEFPGCEGVPEYTDLVQRHRIIPGRDGGKYKKGNVISLCPNHHALADRDLINANELLEIVRKRIEETIGEETSTESPGGSGSSEESWRKPTEESSQSNGKCATDGADGFFTRLLKW